MVFETEKVFETNLGYLCDSDTCIWNKKTDCFDE